MIVSNEVKLASFEKQQKVKNCISPRNRLLLLLALDAAAFPSEAVTMKWRQINFGKKCIELGEHRRTIPMTAELFAAAQNWWKVASQKTEIDTESYIFPAVGNDVAKGHIDRTSAARIAQTVAKTSFEELRATCIAKILSNDETPLKAAAKIAGISIVAVERYRSIDDETLRTAFERIEPKTSLVARFVRRFAPKPRAAAFVVPASVGAFKFHVGRLREIERMNELFEKRVNFYLKSPRGFGKTQLLETLSDPRIIRIHEFKSPKKLLESLLVRLAELQKPVVITADRQRELERTITAKSAKQLADLAIWSTEKREFSLLLDKADDLSPTSAKVLDQLAQHFHVIVAAREIAPDRAEFLSSFEKIELPPLNDSEARELFEKISQHLNLKKRTDDYEKLTAHVINSTRGNPLFIIEHTSRFGLENWIPSHTIQEFKHTSASEKNQLDLSPFVIAALVLFGLYKYVGREIDPEDKNAYFVIGGAAIAFVLMIRLITIAQRAAKQKSA